MEYYQIAPEIGKRINASVDPHAVYLSLCADYIRPALAAIERSDFQATHSLYKSMVQSLTTRFLTAPQQSTAST